MLWKISQRCEYLRLIWNLKNIRGLFKKKHKNLELYADEDEKIEYRGIY